MTCTTGLGNPLVQERDLPSSHPDQSLFHVLQMLQLRFIVQRYQALGMIFGLLCDHVPST